MKILVVSDSHGRVANLETALGFENYDKIIYLGDGILDLLNSEMVDKSKLVLVKGNNDDTDKVPSDEILEIEGKRFFITHGHNYNVKYGIKNLVKAACKNNADIILYGHTHIPLQCELENKIICINPGSIGKGKLNQHTFAIIDIDKEKNIFNCRICKIN